MLIINESRYSDFLSQTFLVTHQRILLPHFLSNKSFTWCRNGDTDGGTTSSPKG